MSSTRSATRKVDAQRARHEFQLAHVRDQRQQRIPIAVDIGEQDRLLVAAELRPGELLDDLFERADAARQRDEGVGALEHGALALVHVAGDDQLLRRSARALPRGHEFRNDPGRLAAVVEDGFGDRAHQADRAAAVDEPHAVLGEDFAELLRGLDERRVGARARSAIDADRIDFAHSLILIEAIDVASIRARCKRFGGLRAGAEPGKNALYD